MQYHNLKNIRVLLVVLSFLILKVFALGVFDTNMVFANHSLRPTKIGQEKSEKYLLKYFDVQDTLYLNLKDLTIGEITRFIPTNDDSVVFIHDRIANSVFWVNLKTGLHKVLSIEEVVPGHKLQILATYKDPITGIWLASAPNFLFKFDENGIITKHISLSSHSLSTKFCVDYDGNAIVYIDDTYPNYLLRINSKDNEARKLFDLKTAENYKNLLFRMDGGGLLIDNPGFIYFANPIENKMYKYDYSGTLSDIFKSRSKEYVLIEKDIPSDKEGMFAFFRNKPNFSSVLFMYFLNSDLIAVFYLIEGRADMEIFSKEDGAVMNKERIRILHSTMVGAGNNFLYLAHQPEPTKKGANLPNPFVIRFKLRPHALIK